MDHWYWELLLLFGGGYLEMHFGFCFFICSCKLDCHQEQNFVLSLKFRNLSKARIPVPKWTFPNWDAFMICKFFSFVLQLYSQTQMHPKMPALRSAIVASLLLFTWLRSVVLTFFPHREPRSNTKTWLMVSYQYEEVLIASLFLHIVSTQSSSES